MGGMSMENEDFSDAAWQSTPTPHENTGNTDGANESKNLAASGEARPENATRVANQDNTLPGPDPLDYAGVGNSTLECTVTVPLKENDGGKDAYVSYLVTTHTNFPSFQKPTTTVRRRFTDFVFLYKTLSDEYPQCAVPPLPDKHSMMYVTGDRFSEDFVARRAMSLNRFLRRLTLHPVLRRSALLIIFLESQDWNATMRGRATRSASNPDGGVMDSLTETFMNAFAKIQKVDRRFVDVKEKSDKLDEDLGHIEKIVVRVTRRLDELSKDHHELGENFQKLVVLEPGIDQPVRGFVASVEDQSRGVKKLRDLTDHDYLGSLRDMQAYSQAVKGLLKLRNEKQVDFEQTAILLANTTQERDRLVGSGANSGLTGLLRGKVEDLRGVDHEQARRKRVREAELRIEELTAAVEETKKVTEAFDEEVIREVADFERIKRIEFKSQFGGLADANVEYFGSTIATWERYVREMEGQGVLANE